ncbi:GH24425 [Drosophila grimshawi]|uniref:GH24425 n=1 Tax=Drosophila grimshawi TaxID=7222 RepID=B4JLZ8_DROGR|nr:GH24425 [Drosophila grimshawi]
MWAQFISLILFACLAESQRCQDEQHLQQPIDYTQCGRPVCATNGYCYRTFNNICCLDAFNLQLLFAGQRELVQADMVHCLPRSTWYDYNAFKRPRPLPRSYLNDATSAVASASAYANGLQYPYESEPYPYESDSYNYHNSQNLYSPVPQNTHRGRNDYASFWDQYSVSNNIHHAILNAVNNAIPYELHSNLRNNS